MLLAALLLAGQEPVAAADKEFDRTGWIFSTVAHSEWCPAGNVRLDLRSGAYILTVRASRGTCSEPGLERPVRQGILDREALTALRAGFLRVEKEGFETHRCRHGKPHDLYIVNNGGTPTLVVSNGAGTGVAPNNLTCWNDAANDLHALLDETFSAARTR